MTQAFHRTHPGAADMPRRIALKSSAARSFLVELKGGKELFAACRKVAQNFGGGAMMFWLTDLSFEEAALHVIEDDPQNARMIRYGEAIVVPQACSLVSAQMTVGWDGDVPLLHAHGYLRRADGSLLGGHLAPGRCILSRHAPPSKVRLTVLEDLSLESRFDAETGFNLLVPALAARSSRGALAAEAAA